MKKLWMLLAGAALVMSSCSNDDTDGIVPPPVPEEGFKTLSEISAVLPESRTYLEDHEWGASAKTLWATGDCISVWSKEEPNPVLFRLEGDGGVAEGTFRAVGEGSVKGTEFYALYNGNTTTASKTVTLNATQSQYTGGGTNSIASGIAPMAAYTTGEAPDYAESFQFKNLCGIMALTLKADADVRLSKLDFVGGEPLSGSGEVTFSGSEASFSLTSNALNNVTRTCSIDMKKDQEYTVYVVVPAAEYQYMSVSAYIASNPNTPVLKRVRSGSSNAFTISKGQMTRIAKFDVKTVAPHVYAVGDVYPNGATGADVKGIVFEAAEDGLSGKIVYSTVVGSAVWADSSITGESNYPSSANDGETNMAIAKNGGIEKYPAFALCSDLTPISSKYSWYLPAQKELELLTTVATDVNIASKAFLGKELIDMTENKVRYWSSTGSFSNNRLRAFNAYYNIVEDEESGDTEESWKLVNSYATMSNNVLPISKFESK